MSFTMLTFLVWVLLAAVCSVAFWIAHLVKDLNDRFDQIDHSLDLILDQLKKE
jgi:hypothetical protein